MKYSRYNYPEIQYYDHMVSDTWKHLIFENGEIYDLAEEILRFFGQSFLFCLILWADNIIEYQAL